MKKYYLAGPSRELKLKPEGEANVEILFNKLKRLGVPPIYNWAADIRKFNQLTFPSKLEKKQTFANYMRNDYDYIIKADFVVFALIDTFPSIGMKMEAGLSTFLAKPIVFYLPEKNRPVTISNEKFMVHDFFSLCRTQTISGSVEELAKFLA